MAWERKSKAIDTLLASVVFIKLQYMDRPRVAVVPFFSWKGQGHRSDPVCPCGVSRGPAPGYWAGAFSVTDAGISALFLGGSGLGSPIFLGASAVALSRRLVHRHNCYGGLGRSPPRYISLSGCSLQQAGERHCAAFALLSARCVTMPLLAFVDAHASFPVHERWCGYHARISDPCPHRSIHQETEYAVALLSGDSIGYSIYHI